MAYTTINKSSSFMNTKLYTGNGSARSITGVGFQPDWLWIKQRSGAENHQVFDAVRTAGKQLETNTNSAESSTSLQSAFDSDGFSINNAAEVNGNGATYASWNWKAGTAVSGNTGGSGSYKTYTGSVNTTSGFSIIKYTGNGTAGHTIPHHLSAIPKMIIVKRLNSADNWRTYHGSLGATKALDLNGTGAANAVGSSRWNNTEPTSSVFTVGTGSGVNANDSTYIAYCFAEKTGYSKFGSYTGNGNADGTFVYTGFKPAWILVKVSSTGDSWQLIDNKRDAFNSGTESVLQPDLSQAEGQSVRFDMLSNGLKMRTTNVSVNSNGNSYIYAAFGQTLVGTNNIPNNAF